MSEKKGKKMENTVVEAEAREVDFGDALELKISKPSLCPDKTIKVTGNFTELGNKIQVVVDKYKGTVLTEDNVSYVKTLKSQFVSLRTGIERERKDWKKVYITPASKAIDAMCDELQKIVSEGEDALGKQLDEYDQKRKNELTLILNEYVADSVKKHNLREEYASQIVLKKEYYNKTQNEEETADDIEEQAVELEKKQNEYDSSVALIKAECEEAGFLSETYIRELAYKSATEIILEIKSDKKIAQEAKEEAEEKGKVTIGQAINEQIQKSVELNGKEEKAEKRTRLLKITYTAEQALLLKTFFEQNGIQFEFVKTEF